jgi:hypothetical protein
MTMDPITLAAKRFACEFKSFWRPPPGRSPRQPSVLRLVVSRTYREDMLKALRVMEWQPDSRRPFVIVDAAFTSEATFALAVASALEAAYDKLRDGLGEDGLTIPPLAPGVRPVTTDRLAALLGRAAEGVSRALDGLVLVLVPASIADGALYGAFALRLAPLSHGSTLRMCVLDHPSLNRTFAGQARFAIDHDALFAFLKDLTSNRSNGPAASASRLTPTDKALLETALKRRIPSRATGDQLRTMLLEAGKAMGDGQFKAATRKFRAARMLCHLSGLTEKEAASSIAAGTAALAAQDKRAALLAYHAAKRIALAAQLPSMAAQAELGIAVAHWSTRDFQSARASYAEVVRLAESSPALRLEAMRMQTACLVSGPEVSS